MYKAIMAKEEERKEAIENFDKTKAIPTIVALEKRLKENSSQDYLVGDKLTAADVVWVDFIWSHALNPSNPEDTNKVTEEKLKEAPLFWAYVNKRKADFAGRYDTRKPSKL